MITAQHKLLIITRSKHSNTTQRQICQVDHASEFSLPFVEAIITIYGPFCVFIMCGLHGMCENWWSFPSPRWLAVRLPPLNDSTALLQTPRLHSKKYRRSTAALSSTASLSSDALMSHRSKGSKQGRRSSRADTFYSTCWKLQIVNYTYLYFFMLSLTDWCLLLLYCFFILYFCIFLNWGFCYVGTTSPLSFYFSIH